MRKNSNARRPKVVREISSKDIKDAKVRKTFEEANRLLNKLLMG